MPGLGVLERMREREFGGLPLQGAAPDWELTYGDFAPYYERAEQLYRVHGVRGWINRARPQRSLGTPARLNLGWWSSRLP